MYYQRYNKYQVQYYNPWMRSIRYHDITMYLLTSTQKSYFLNYNTPSVSYPPTTRPTPTPKGT